MATEYEKKLEERIHQELARVPERIAPADLAANVLGKIKARETRPWWRRPIPDWPRHNRFAFVGMMAAFVVLAVAGLVQIWPQEIIEGIPAQAAAAVDPVRPVFSVAETLGRAGALLLRSISSPWLIGVGAALFFAYLSCIGMGMAWYRVTFQKGLSRA
jgi:hypothetical protein